MEKVAREVLCQDYEEVEEVLVGFQLKGANHETIKLCCDRCKKWFVKSRLLYFSLFVIRHQLHIEKEVTVFSITNKRYSLKNNSKIPYSKGCRISLYSYVSITSPGWKSYACHPKTTFISIPTENLSICTPHSLPSITLSTSFLKCFIDVKLFPLKMIYVVKIIILAIHCYHEQLCKAFL